MKRIPGEGDLPQRSGRTPADKSQELAGLVGLGMRDEALRLARRTLKATGIAPESFNAAVHAIVAFGNRFKRWSRLVESAYARLPDKKTSHYWMLYFHCCNRDYEAAAALGPDSLEGLQLSELVLAMEAALAVGKMSHVEKLATRISDVLFMAEDPATRAQLEYYLAEYHARKGDWNEAIRRWQMLSRQKAVCRRAVTGIVQLYVGCALREIRRGLRFIEKFKGEDLDIAETIVPGSAQEFWEYEAKPLRRLEKMLEKVVSKERQKQLGIDTHS